MGLVYSPLASWWGPCLVQADQVLEEARGLNLDLKAARRKLTSVAVRRRVFCTGRSLSIRRPQRWPTQ